MLQAVAPAGGLHWGEGTEFWVTFIEGTRKNIIRPCQPVVPLPSAPHGGYRRPLGPCPWQAVGRRNWGPQPNHKRVPNPRERAAPALQQVWAAGSPRPRTLPAHMAGVQAGVTRHTPTEWILGTALNPPPPWDGALAPHMCWQTAGAREKVTGSFPERRKETKCFNQNWNLPLQVELLTVYFL